MEWGLSFLVNPPLLLYFFFSWKLQTPPQPPSPPAAAAVSFWCLVAMKPSISHTLNPLSSIFVTFYTLILLYFPSFFFNLLFSPVFISSVFLLLFLLRFGAAQQENCEPESIVEPDRSCGRSFVEWDVGAPLEVIHENYCEGEDALDDDDVVSLQTSLHRYPSLSRYYPETDSDSDFDSDSDSSSSIERPSFSWEGEDKFDQEKDGLIEIQLHDHFRPKTKILEDLLEFQIEEENFIEIDISPVHSGAGR